MVKLVVKNNWTLLKALRKHLGLNQKGLAAKTGISQPTLSQIENSDNHRDATIEKLTAAMGVKPE